MLVTYYKFKASQKNWCLTDLFKFLDGFFRMFNSPAEWFSEETGMEYISPPLLFIFQGSVEHGMAVNPSWPYNSPIPEPLSVVERAGKFAREWRWSSDIRGIICGSASNSILEFGVVFPSDWSAHQLAWTCANFRTLQQRCDGKPSVGNALECCIMFIRGMHCLWKRKCTKAKQKWYWSWLHC